MNKEDIGLIYQKYYSLRANPIFEKIFLTRQHRTSNTFRHVCLVTEACIKYGIKHNKKYDYDSLIKGAMLHDFYFYDWRKDRSKMKKHLTSHPRTAFKNACYYFDLNETEVDIILNHMWPVTIKDFPKTSEGKLVMMMDKLVTLKEFFSRKKSILIFSFPVLLVDYPSLFIDCFKTYGINLTNDDISTVYSKGLLDLCHLYFENDYKDFYLKIISDLRVRLVDAITINKSFKNGLRDLKRGGYRIFLVSTLEKELVKEICEKEFPFIFENVIHFANDFDMDKNSVFKNVKNIIPRVKRNKIIFIGECKFDFSLAVKQGIKCMFFNKNKHSFDTKLKNKRKVIFLDDESEFFKKLLKE